MRRLLLTALLAAALPGIARSQPGPGQPGYDPYDAPPSGCDRPPPPPRRNTMPSYHEGPMPPPPPGGGYHDSYGTADVAADQQAATLAPPPPPFLPGKRDPHYARAHFAAKIARWRARAAACEAGDLAACEAPAN